MTFSAGRDRIIVRDPEAEHHLRARIKDMPAASQETLGSVISQETADVFSDVWVLVGIAFIVAGFLWQRHAAFIALGIGLLLIFMVGRWWRNNSLNGVQYVRSFDRTHLFPGETVHVSLSVHNNKQLPLTWLQFFDRTPLPPNSGTRIDRIMAELFSDTMRRFSLKTAYSLQPYEKIQRQLAFTLPRRGFYRFGPVRYESGDPFTLFTLNRTHDYRELIVVYPQLWPLAELQLPAKELFGDLKTRRSLFTDPIKTQGTRDYQPQDRFRDVHWKATARRGKLQSKVYDPSTGMSVVLFLNVATSDEFWLGQNPDLLDRAVSVAASIANFSAQENWSIGLVANGSVPGSDQPIRVRPGRSPAQLVKVLEALAAVTEFPTGPLERLMHRESPRLPWAATFVIVSAFLTEQFLAGLLMLQNSGRRIALISLADLPVASQGNGAGMVSSILDKITVYHIPSTLPAFEKGFKAQTATQAALHTIITSEPVNLTLDRVEHDNANANN